MISSSILNPITEVNYLSAQNVARYRTIIRIFYLEHEKINYWLYKEFIFEKMKETNFFPEYTLEMCQQDLQSLTEWKNLFAIQDSQKVRTIEDFKNRSFRYQLSKVSVEIERMTMRLEKLDIEGSSLEPSLISKFYEDLKKHKQVMSSSSEEIHHWIDTLINDFVRLNQSYQDYIKTLNSAKAEEMMKTTEFLLFKDKLISYLRVFVKTMQEKGMMIHTLLEQIDDEEIDYLIQKATDYEMSIPRIDVEVSQEEIYKNYQEKWNSIWRWFIGDNGMNEVDRLNEISQEIIRKITKYAQQIVEMNNRGSNRKEQYYHMAQVFKECDSLFQAHKLSSFLFGVENCLNPRFISDRKTENIHSGIYDEEPSDIHFETHARVVTKKNSRKACENYAKERERQKRELEEKMEKQRQIVQNLIHEGVLDFNSLPEIDSFTRKTLLSWVSKAISCGGTGKTDEDQIFIIDRTNEETECILKCEDGLFYMPAFRLIFKEKDNDEY